MNKYIKVLGIFVLMIFSFYYTEKVALYVQNNTPLKKEIISYKEKNSINFVNAQIDGDYIVPGINGLEVNVDKSYDKMKSYNVFSENNLIYDQITPEVSVTNYKNKIIKSGNVNKNAVSIILSKNNKNIKYFKENNIVYDLLTKTNYCIKSHFSSCSKTGKQVVEPTINFTNLLFLKQLKNITKGCIIYIDDDLAVEYIRILINYIKYNNLNILNLNNHLSEYYQP